PQIEQRGHQIGFVVKVLGKPGPKIILLPATIIQSAGEITCVTAHGDHCCPSHSGVDKALLSALAASFSESEQLRQEKASRDRGLGRLQELASPQKRGGYHP